MFQTDCLLLLGSTDFISLVGDFCNVLYLTLINIPLARWRIPSVNSMLIFVLPSLSFRYEVIVALGICSPCKSINSHQSYVFKYYHWRLNSHMLPLSQHPITPTAHYLRVGLNLVLRLKYILACKNRPLPCQSPGTRSRTTRCSTSSILRIIFTTRSGMPTSNTNSLRNSMKL